MKSPPPEPRKPIFWQYYRTTNSDAVNAEYERRGGSTPEMRLAVCNAIAQEQYTALPEADRQALEDAALAQYEVDMEEWIEACKNLEEVTPEQQKR